MSSIYEIFSTIQRQRVSDGQIVPILSDCADYKRLLILVWPQLGDFDSLEYAWWLEKEAALCLKFAEYTKFRQDWLFVDPKAELHNLLGLYRGLSLKLPRFSPGQNAWLNLILMCAGVGSPGTLAEVLRGYLGDRKAPQLIAEEETIQARPLPPFRGSLFNLAGGQGFQRPFELATLRLRNMGQVLGNWSTYIPDSSYLTQRGGTFLFDSQGKLLYEHRDGGILGFAENMSYPLAFLRD